MKNGKYWKCFQTPNRQRCRYDAPIRHADSNPEQWYNLHYNLSGNAPKIVIHTRQLSMAITDALLGEMAKEVEHFAVNI